MKDGLSLSDEGGADENERRREPPHFHLEHQIGAGDQPQSEDQRRYPRQQRGADGESAEGRDHGHTVPDPRQLVG